MPLTTVSNKGQLVIPKEVREALRIKPRQKVLVKMAKGHAELIPVPENPVETFCGIFEQGSSLVKPLLKERKEERKREEKDTSRFLRPSNISKKRK